MSDPFHVHNGPAVQTVAELRQALPSITDEQIAHHIAKGRNDLADWAAGSLKDEGLAMALRPCTAREEVEQALDAWIAQHTQTRIDDAAFDRMKDDANRHNEAAGDRFEEVTHRMEEALKDPVPEELVQLDEQLVQRYDELRARISDLRKQGRDLFIASLTLRPFMAKMALARATRDRKDFEKVKLLLDQGAFEADEAERASILDIKAEVDRLAGIERPKEDL